MKKKKKKVGYVQCFDETVVWTGEMALLLRVPILLLSITWFIYPRCHKETTELDQSMGRKKDLLGFKLPRPSGVGQMKKNQADLQTLSRVERDVS